MALEAKQKIYVKTRANFDNLIKGDNPTIGNNHLVFIEDTNEIWTHGHFFSGRSFKSISDGTTTASSGSTSGTINFTGAGKVSVTVGEGGVTITGADATVATGDENGQVKIDGQNVSVKGLGSAAYQDTTAFTAAAHATNKSNPHEVTAAQVGLGNVTNESKATMFTNPAFTGTPTAPTAAAGTNTTQIATTAFVKSAIDNVLGASDAMVFKGTLGTGGTITALPASHQVGDTYKVATAGTYAGAVCEVGDMIICVTTGTAANNADWTVVQTNIDGAVTGPASSTANHIATFSGTNGKVIADSGYTIATSVPSGAVFTDESVTSVDNHYAPEADAGSEITATAGTAAAYALDTEYEVVTGVKAQRDAKGHVTGMSVTTQKVKDTHVTPGDKALKIASGSGTAKKAITMNEGTADKTLTITGDGTWITGAVSGSDGAATVTLSHGKPSTGSALTTSNGTAAAYALNTEYEVITGITVSADSKGHITGVSTTRQKVKDTNTTVASGINMTGYTKAAAEASIAAADTVDVAIGKLEYKIDSAVSDASWAEYN
jgi:hypothetical protein